MENNLVLLRRQLVICQSVLKKSYDNLMATNLYWLNAFCAECLKFANIFQSYIVHDLENYEVEGIEPLETSFLCLTQVVCCIKHLERSIKVEETRGVTIPASRQHFLGRINFCLRRLRESLDSLDTMDKMETERPFEEQTFVQLMDLLLEDLIPFSDYNNYDNDMNNTKNNSLRIRDENGQAQSKQFRTLVNLILGHTLAFANVALQQDKKAISAICQKVLRECCDFQEEFDLNQEDFQVNTSNRKLKAMSFENALYQLEDFTNEALLRLVFTCFRDFDKFSVEKLRSAIRSASDADVTIVDELIADFDVNVDRCTQIGVFAIAFAPNMKMKTIIRSCLASFESLDTCLVPSLQTRIGNSHPEILERHFKEEVINFKNVMQEIIDTQSFSCCYLDMLSDCIRAVEKNYQQTLLEETIEMGVFLCEHFRFAVNQRTLNDVKHPERRQHFESFCMILRECQAILRCADQVESHRVLKRFKILRNILRRLYESLDDNGNSGHRGSVSNNFHTSEEFTNSQSLFESMGICPSICSILYSNERPKRRNLTASVSLKRDYSKLSANHASFASPGTAHSKAIDQHANLLSNALAYQTANQRNSLRRKESLRTAMFKRLNVAGSENSYKPYKLDLANSQINTILDELSTLSCSFSGSSGRDDVLSPIPHS